jgi:hypothetical protein
MSFTGNEGEEFPLELAVQWTANYREQNPNKIKGHAFGEKLIRKILAQKHCLGLRMYYALDEKGVQQMIVVGVDKYGNDLCNGIIMERGSPCPPFCDSGGSPLNK